MTEPVIIQKRPPKSPAVAGILSAFLPGIGSLYNGLYTKGILFILIFAGLVTMQDRGGQPFFGLLLAGFYFFQIIDSVNNAKAINKAAAGELTPEGAPIPAPSIDIPTPAGSIFWGAVLMILGLVFLLGNFNVIDYDRLWDFWPVIVIVIGIKMIADYFSKKNT
ncbi:MAG: hypothetical protein JW843_01820 [Candidatus Aminicenantes bacterium]|nr:hypothetical protein [Candidatus Aminicenantes bacterium]